MTSFFALENSDEREFFFANKIELVKFNVAIKWTGQSH